MEVLLMWSKDDIGPLHLLALCNSSGSLLWAFTAKIDKTVSVRGRLEPSGSVRDVGLPVQE